MMDRKGGLEDATDLLFTSLAVIFGIFFLSLALQGAVDKSHEETVKHIEELQSKWLMLDYLKTPVDVAGEQALLADLVVWSVEHEDYEKLETITEQLLKQEGDRYYITISDTADFSEEDSELEKIAEAKIIIKRADLRDKPVRTMEGSFIHLPQGVTVEFKFKPGDDNE